MNEIGGNLGLLSPPSAQNVVGHVSNEVIQRQHGKAVVTFSSLLTGKEEEIASDTDTLLTLSPLTISAHEMESDQSSIAVNVLTAGIGAEPLWSTHQQTGPHTHEDITPTLATTSQVTYPLCLSASETSSSSSFVTFKPSDTRTKLRVPTSKLREIPPPSPAHSSMKTSPCIDDTPSGATVSRKSKKRSPVRLKSSSMLKQGVLQPVHSGRIGHMTKGTSHVTHGAGTTGMLDTSVTVSRPSTTKEHLPPVKTKLAQRLQYPQAKQMAAIHWVGVSSDEGSNSLAPTQAAAHGEGPSPTEEVTKLITESSKIATDTCLATLRAQGIVNVGSTTGGLGDEDGCGKERSRVVTTDEPGSNNPGTKTGRRAVEPISEHIVRNEDVSRQAYLQTDCLSSDVLARMQNIEHAQLQTAHLLQSVREGRFHSSLHQPTQILVSEETQTAGAKSKERDVSPFHLAQETRSELPNPGSDAKSTEKQEARPTAPTPEDVLVAQNATCTLGELRRSRDRLLLEHCAMERQETSPLCDPESMEGSLMPRVKVRRFIEELSCKSSNNLVKVQGERVSCQRSSVRSRDKAASVWSLKPIGGQCRPVRDSDVLLLKRGSKKSQEAGAATVGAGLVQGVVTNLGGSKLVLPPPTLSSHISSATRHPSLLSHHSQLQPGQLLYHYLLGGGAMCLPALPPHPPHQQPVPFTITLPTPEVAVSHSSTPLPPSSSPPPCQSIVGMPVTASAGSPVREATTQTAFNEEETKEVTPPLMAGTTSLKIQVLPTISISGTQEFFTSEQEEDVESSPTSSGQRDLFPTMTNIREEDPQDISVLNSSQDTSQDPLIALQGQPHWSDPLPDIPLAAPLSSGVEGQCLSAVEQEQIIQDYLCRKSQEWMREELLARMLITFPSVRKPVPSSLCSSCEEEGDGGSLVDHTCHESVATFLVGAEGLQLFVDEGITMDGELITRLVREVILQIAVTMLRDMRSERNQGDTSCEDSIHYSDTFEDLTNSSGLKTPVVPTPDLTPPNSLPLEENASSTQNSTPVDERLVATPSPSPPPSPVHPSKEEEPFGSDIDTPEESEEDSFPSHSTPHGSSTTSSSKALPCNYETVPTPHPSSVNSSSFSPSTSAHEPTDKPTESKSIILSEPLSSSFTPSPSTLTYSTTTDEELSSSTPFPLLALPSHSLSEGEVLASPGEVRWTAPQASKRPSQLSWLGVRQRGQRVRIHDDRAPRRKEESKCVLHPTVSAFLQLRDSSTDNSSFSDTSVTGKGISKGEVVIKRKGILKKACAPFLLTATGGCYSTNSSSDGGSLHSDNDSTLDGLPSLSDCNPQRQTIQPNFTHSSKPLLREISRKPVAALSMQFPMTHSEHLSPGEVHTPHDFLPDRTPVLLASSSEIINMAVLSEGEVPQALHSIQLPAVNDASASSGLSSSFSNQTRNGIDVINISQHSSTQPRLAVADQGAFSVSTIRIH